MRKINEGEYIMLQLFATAERNFKAQLCLLQKFNFIKNVHIHYFLSAVR